MSPLSEDFYNICRLWCLCQWCFSNYFCALLILHSQKDLLPTFLYLYSFITHWRTESNWQSSCLKSNSSDDWHVIYLTDDRHCDKNHEQASMLCCLARISAGFWNGALFIYRVWTASRSHCLNGGNQRLNWQLQLSRMTERRGAAKHCLRPITSTAAQ